MNEGGVITDDSRAMLRDLALQNVSVKSMDAVVHAVARTFGIDIRVPHQLDGAQLRGKLHRNCKFLKQSS